MKRRCNSCQPDHRVEATVVAQDREGMMWFECGDHGPTDNVAQVVRTKTTPIEEWFHSIGIALEDLEDLQDEPAPPTQRPPSPRAA